MRSIPRKLRPSKYSCRAIRRPSSGLTWPSLLTVKVWSHTLHLYRYFFFDKVLTSTLDTRFEQRHISIKTLTTTHNLALSLDMLSPVSRYSVPLRDDSVAFLQKVGALVMETS